MYDVLKTKNTQRHGRKDDKNYGNESKRQSQHAVALQHYASVRVMCRIEKGANVKYLSWLYGSSSAGATVESPDNIPQHTFTRCWRRVLGKSRDDGSKSVRTVVNANKVIVE